MGNDDRTIPHPLYWVEHQSHDEPRANLGIRGTKTGCRLRGTVDVPLSAAWDHATELTWEHADALRREGYMLALERVRNFGADLKGDQALTDEERYILPQAAEVLELQAP